MTTEVLTTDVGAVGAPRREVRDGVRIRRHRAAFVAHTPIAPGLLLALLRQPRGTLVHVHAAHALVVELVWLACWLRGLRYVVHFHLDVDASGPRPVAAGLQALVVRSVLASGSPRDRADRGHGHLPAPALSHPT